MKWLLKIQASSQISDFVLLCTLDSLINPFVLRLCNSTLPVLISRLCMAKVKYLNHCDLNQIKIINPVTRSCIWYMIFYSKTHRFKFSSVQNVVFVR